MRKIRMALALALAFPVIAAAPDARSKSSGVATVTAGMAQP